MSEYRKLNTTPIKEIIFTISYNENITENYLKDFCNIPGVSEKFTGIKEGFRANIHKKEDEKPISNVINDGYVLRSQSSNNVIRVKVGSFAFHKVKEYEPFEILFDELTNLWDKFISVTGPLTINSISLRYLNFIEINEGELIDELINVSVNHPYDYDLSNQLIHLHFKKADNPALKINIVTAKATDNKKDGLILDIILHHDINNSTDYKASLNTYHYMRGIKNEIFFKTLTAHSLKKYDG